MCAFRIEGRGMEMARTAFHTYCMRNDHQRYGLRATGTRHNTNSNARHPRGVEGPPPTWKPQDRLQTQTLHIQAVFPLFPTAIQPHQQSCHHASSPHKHPRLDRKLCHRPCQDAIPVRSCPVFHGTGTGRNGKSRRVVFGRRSPPSLPLKLCLLRSPVRSAVSFEDRMTMVPPLDPTRITVAMANEDKRGVPLPFKSDCHSHY